MNLILTSITHLGLWIAMATSYFMWQLFFMATADYPGRRLVCFIFTFFHHYDCVVFFVCQLLHLGHHNQLENACHNCKARCATFTIEEKKVNCWCGPAQPAVTKTDGDIIAESSSFFSSVFYLFLHCIVYFHCHFFHSQHSNGYDVPCVLFELKKQIAASALSVIESCTIDVMHQGGRLAHAVRDFVLDFVSKNVLEVLDKRMHSICGPSRMLTSGIRSFFSMANANVLIICMQQNTYLSFSFC